MVLIVQKSDTPSMSGEFSLFLIMVRDETGHSEETERILKDWPI